MKRIFVTCLILLSGTALLVAENIKGFSSEHDLQKVLAVPPKPIDPQIIQDQDNMTWEDYHPIPGKNWADPSLVPERKFRMALVAVDFPDQPFVITLPKNQTFSEIHKQIR